MGCNLAYLRDINRQKFFGLIDRNLRSPGPLQARIETVADDSDLEDVYNTERHLLYVACTRARDQLLDTSVEPASEFLEDLLM